MLPWIFLLLSAGAWWIVFTTRSMVELVIALLAAFAFLLLGFFGLLTARVGHVTRSQSAREKALLLTSRPKPPTAAKATTGADAGVPVGVDLGVGPTGGRTGAARARHEGDRDGDRQDSGNAADGGGDGGGGGD